MAQKPEAILDRKIRVALSKMDGVSVLPNPSGFCECKGIRFGAGGTGTPDLIVVAGGKFIGMELKAETNQSGVQKKFEARLKAKQPEHVYVVVRSVEEAVAIVEEVME